MANNADPDQMPHSVSSDLGLHCLQMLSVPILRVIMAVLKLTFLFNKQWKTNKKRYCKLLKTMNR